LIASRFGRWGRDVGGDAERNEHAGIVNFHFGFGDRNSEALRPLPVWG
jgi:hypothetical protein